LRSFWRPVFASEFSHDDHTAGTIKPLRVFVIGVGVAGLQAIATARR
jgi:NAD/NADP transhydrogenase alpha subunit